MKEDATPGITVQFNPSPNQNLEKSKKLVSITNQFLRHD